MVASPLPRKRWRSRCKGFSVSHPCVPRHEDHGKDQAAWTVSPRFKRAAVRVGAERNTQVSESKTTSVSMSCAANSAVLPVPAAPVTIQH